MSAFEIAIDLEGNHIRCFIEETQGGTEEIRMESGPDPGLLRCIGEGARKWGATAQDLLGKTRLVTLSAPDVITDTLARKNGARIGLMVSKGHEKKVYFEGEGDNPAIGSVLTGDMIVGVEEEVDDQGGVPLKPSELEVKEKVRHLLEFGSGIIVVSLKNAIVNPGNERLVKDFIETDYPRHYLGAVPVLVSSEFGSERDDFLRTAVCLLNAYAWFNLDRFLRGVETLLQKNGYNHGLMARQADGHKDYIHNINPLRMSAPDPVAFARSWFHFSHRDHRVH